jgi:hypothetical protein
MANEEDVRGTKAARAEIGRRGFDITHTDIRVMHGICYVRGTIKVLRGSNIPDGKTEMEKLAKILRSKPEIKDVVLDCIFRT